MLDGGDKDKNPFGVTRPELNRHESLNKRIDVLKAEIVRSRLEIPENYLKDQHYWFNVFRAYIDHTRPFTEGYQELGGHDQSKLRETKRATLFQLALREGKMISDLEKKMGTDPLTGLWNRGVLDTRVTQLQEWLKNDTYGDSLVILMLADVDGFKQVNDTWGHSVGDEVLRRFGKAAREQVKGDLDTVARYGGEEFVILLPISRKALLDMRTKRGQSLENIAATKIAERVRRNIVDGLPVRVNNDVVLRPTVSVGMVFIDPSQDLASVYASADKFLYEAKHLGKNQTVTVDGPVPNVEV